MVTAATATKCKRPYGCMCIGARRVTTAHRPDDGDRRRRQQERSNNSPGPACAPSHGRHSQDCCPSRQALCPSIRLIMGGTQSTSARLPCQNSNWDAHNAENSGWAAPYPRDHVGVRRATFCCGLRTSHQPNGPQGRSNFVAENGEDGIRTHRDRMWRDRRDQDQNSRWREDQRKFRPMPAPETVREPGNSHNGSRGSPEAVYRLARGNTRIEIRCPPAVLERCVKAGNQLIREVLTEPDVAAPDEEPRGKPAPNPAMNRRTCPKGDRELLSKRLSSMRNKLVSLIAIMAIAMTVNVAAAQKGGGHGGGGHGGGGHGGGGHGGGGGGKGSVGSPSFGHGRGGVGRGPSYISPSGKAGGYSRSFRGHHAPGVTHAPRLSTGRGQHRYRATPNTEQHRNAASARASRTMAAASDRNSMAAASDRIRRKLTPSGGCDSLARTTKDTITGGAVIGTTTADGGMPPHGGWKHTVVTITGPTSALRGGVTAPDGITAAWPITASIKGARTECSGPTNRLNTHDDCLATRPL